MNRTVAVTGAGGALAQAVIPLFESEGWNLALFAHGDSTAARLERDHPRSFVVQVGLHDEAATKTAVEAVTGRFGHIDALLNVAGGFAMSGATETTSADLDEQLDVNLKTAFSATKAVLPGMFERRSGIIVGVSAGAAISAGAKMGAYAASKAALVAYLKSVRAEVEPRGVGVSILYPMGTIDTPANRESMPNTDPAAWIDPQALAESLLFLVTRPPRGRVRELMVYGPS